MFGAIEAGGTKFVCGVGTGPHDLSTIQIPTTTPEETLGPAIEFLRESSGGKLASVGIASFGPVNLDQNSPSYGRITSSPKIAWRNFDLVHSVAKALRVPIGFDTDVNGAALGEQRWGAAQGLSDFIYLTVGTGIGGGAVVNGRVVHGLVHPEMGHIRVPRDPIRDPFRGVCPYHGDCLEGLASGPAIQERWGKPAQELPEDHPAWALEAHYLALGLATWVCTLSPKRIVIGGGVMQQFQMFDRVRTELARLLNGYIQAPEINEKMAEFVVAPALGGRAGALGALVLAEQAARPVTAHV